MRARAARAAARSADISSARDTAPASTHIHTTAPTHDEIAQLAYEYWQMRAGIGGSAEDDWYRAEREMRERLMNTENFESSTTKGGDLKQFS